MCNDIRHATALLASDIFSDEKVADDVLCRTGAGLRTAPAGAYPLCETHSTTAILSPAQGDDALGSEHAIKNNVCVVVTMP